MSIPPLWGDVGVEKWSSFLVSGTQSTVFWHPKLGTFGKSARFQVLKMGLWMPKNENGDHFFTPTSPQNGGIDICVVLLSLLGALMHRKEQEM